MGGFAGFGSALQGANAAQQAFQEREAASRQLESQQMLVKALQAYAAQQQGGGAPGGAMPPPQAGAAIQPGGVSPLNGGAPPAGAAPGGAGPVAPSQGGAVPPMMSGQPGAPGLDIQRLAQVLQQQGGSSGAQGLAMQDIIKMMQPQANNATRVEIAGARNDTSASNTDKRVGAEKRGQDLRAGSAAAHDKTSADNNTKRINAEMAKMDNDALSKQFTSVGNSLRGMPPDNPDFTALSDRYTALGQELNKRRAAHKLDPKDTTPPAGAADPASTAIAVPEQFKGDPDKTRYADGAGGFLVKKGNVLVPETK